MDCPRVLPGPGVLRQRQAPPNRLRRRPFDFSFLPVVPEFPPLRGAEPWGRWTGRPARGLDRAP
eukprot:9324289-Pyramimonas_sp.AAC.1